MATVFLANLHVQGQDLALLSELHSSTKAGTIQPGKEKKPLIDVLNDLEEQFGVRFAVNGNILSDKFTAIELKKDENLDKTLEQILAPFKLTYSKSKVDNFYVIHNVSAKPSEIQKFTSKAISDVESSAQRSNVGTLSAKGITDMYEVNQDRTVTGKVISGEDNEPLPGVNVIVKGTAQGTITDLDGIYKLSVPDASTLVFSSVGYISEEVEVGEKSVIDLTLSPDITTLAELVVVGYGTVKKTDLTGAVSQVSSEDIENMVVISADQALQGRAAGVLVTQAQAEPGGSVSVRIRGGNSINASNQPLYVIDGYPSEYGINDLNPADIQSIDILKDASSIAIYGARGSNGVVMITTKKGKDGKATFNVNSSYGFQQVTKKYDVLNSQQFIEGANAAMANQAALFPSPGQDTVALIPIGGDLYYDTGLDDTIRVYNTDWQDEIIELAPVQSYQLSFRGGTDKARYYGSGEYFGQDGVVTNTFFQRLSARLNGDFQLSDKLSAGMNVLFSRTNQTMHDFDDQSPLQNAIVNPPILPVIKEDGRYTQNGQDGYGYGPQFTNPVAFMREASDELVRTRTQLNVYLEWEIMDALKFKTTLGGDFVNSNRERYYPTIIQEGFNSPGSLSDPGAAWVWYNQNYNYLSESTLTYDLDINEKSRLNLLVGNTLQQGFGKGLNIRAGGFPSDILGVYSFPLAETFDVSQVGIFSGEFALVSFFGRANYVLNDKYIFTATARTDGSSRFGDNEKYAFFPSAAFAWRVIDEPFLQDQSILHDLKLRTSYGLAGNQALPSYFTQQRIRNSGQYIFGGEVSSGLGFADPKANPELGWERTAMFDIGLDMSFLDGRLNVITDYYHKTTEDLLLLTQLQNDPLYNNQWRNVGSVMNEGIELSISYDMPLRGKFQWTTSFNAAYNRNEITELAEGLSHQYVGATTGNPKLNEVAGVRASNILEIGQPMGAFVGLRTNGIYQTEEEIRADPVTYTSGSESVNAKPGDIRFVDINGDNKITSDDFVILGQSQPDFSGGWSNDFKFGNFDLSAFFRYSVGNSVLNINDFILNTVEAGGNTTVETFENQWTGPGTSTTIPRAGYRPPLFVTDQSVQDASFVRLTNLTLGYNVPVQKLNWLTKLRVYATAQNLFTITDYTGYNPEVNARQVDGFAGNASNLALGVDIGSYPFYRTYLLGINISF